MRGTAAVVGGGIGGLAVAIGLRAAGWEVTVFERAAALPETGTGLGIWPEALRALDRLDVGTRARSVGRRQPSGTINKPNGSRIGTVDVDRVERRQGEPVYLLSRPALLGVLADALPEGTVRFDSPVTDPMALRADHDVVIGADGIHSRVRQAIFGDRYRLRYSGATVWRGTVDFEVPTGVETWGRGRKFGLTPQESGRTNWYAMIAAPKGYRPADGDLAELHRLFGSWHQPIPRIVERIDVDGLLRHDLHDLQPLPTFVDGRVALLGDAAHAMTPDLGQGACQTLIDAVALAESFATATDLTHALLDYDRRRRKPTQRIAGMALRVNRLAQARRFVSARDVAVKFALAFGPPS